MDAGSFSGILANLPTDWILLGVLAVITALDVLRSGSTRAATVAIVAPLTLLVTATLPGAVIAGPVSQQFTQPAAEALLFGVIFIILFLFVYRILNTFSENGGVVQASITGVAAVAVLVVVWLQVPALQSLWQFGPQVQMVFGESYRFWWLVAAYAGLAFVRG